MNGSMIASTPVFWSTGSLFGGVDMRQRLLAACRESYQFALPPLVCLTLSKWGLTAAFFASYSSGGQLFDS